MTITLELTPHAERELQRLAARHGVAVEHYASSLIVREVDKAAALDEILRPIREGFAAAGIGENEAEVLFEQAREDESKSRGEAARER